MIEFIGTAQKNKEIIIYYLQDEGNNRFFKANVSHDGFTFGDFGKSQYVFVFDRLQKEEQDFDWTHVRIAKQQDEYILTYKIASEKDGPLYKAISPDLAIWYKIGKVDGLTEAGATVPDYMHGNEYIMYVGGKEITLASSQDLTTWKSNKTPLVTADDATFEIANAFVHNDTILVVYYLKSGKGENMRYEVRAAYFDKNDPEKLLWQPEDPLYLLPDEFYKDTIVPLGCELLHNQIILYWSINGSTLFSVNCPIPVISEIPEIQRFHHLVTKHHKNPILAPRPNVPWDSRASFNSAAIYEDGKVHFLYRALGDTDLSVLGYATSTDGLHIDYRSPEPAYIPREPFETPGNHAFSSLAQHFVSGGGYGGIEDPRVTRVEDTVYLTYVAFDGATPPRVALSSIGIEDFLENNWDKWAKPKLISAPGMVNKSAVVLPKKVNGKYVVMHRVYPNILVDYVDDLAFENYLEGQYFIPPRNKFWDSKKIGAGAPPIETKDGWLLIYQSVGYQDSSRYKIGAMMLDKNRPDRVLYRTPVPIIEPVESYENDGFKTGVVYPCGAVTIKDKLYIYYGGADSYVNAAWTETERFLDEMKHHREPKLHMVTGLVS